MSRPPCCRRVTGTPVACLFKPAGVRTCQLDEVVITLDQFEALRLADVEGLYQEEAAERMHVSRPTFGRILEAARRGVATAVVLGKVLRIEGGTVCPGPGRPREGRCAEDDGDRLDPECPRCRRSLSRRRVDQADE